MVESKRLVDGSQLAVSIDQLLSLGIVAGHPCRELTAVLNVEQHSRHQPRNFTGALRRTERTDFVAREVVDRGNTALVIQFAHRERLETGGLRELVG